MQPTSTPKKNKKFLREIFEGKIFARELLRGIEIGHVRKFGFLRSRVSVE